MARYQLKVLNGSVLTDDGGEPDCPLNARLLGERRVGGGDFPDQVGGLHITADSDALRRNRFGRRRWGRGSCRWHCANDAANHASGGPAWNSTGNATRPASRGWRKIFFFHVGD